MSIIKLFVYAMIVTYSSSLEYEGNLDFHVVEFLFSEDIYLFYDTEHIVFAVNCSIFRELNEQTQFLLDNTYSCERKYVDMFLKKTRDLSTIEKLYRSNDPPKNYSITNSFYYVNFLNKNLFDFVNNTTSKRCQTFQELIAHLNRVYLEINNLLSRNFNELGNILLPWKVKLKLF